MTNLKQDTVHFDRNVKDFVGIDSVLKAQLISAYPNIDIDVELSKMVLWLQSSRGKKRKGTIGFIVNWLKNSTHTNKDQDLRIFNSDLDTYYQEYLEDLWKDKKELLEFNTKR